MAMTVLIRTRLGVIRVRFEGEKRFRLIVESVLLLGVVIVKPLLFSLLVLDVVL